MKTTLLMGMIVLLLPTALARAAAPVRRSQNAGLPFGMLPLVDEINCADTAAAADSHLFTEVPKGASRVETLLGRRCRVLPNVGGSRYFAYRIGKNKNLKAGRAYVLSVEFPEDRPRSLFVLNRGAEMAHGFHTGAALGDALYTYTNNNAESLKIPLSGRFRTWKTLFYLHDRFPDLNLPRGSGPRPLMPADGFWVVIAQAQSASDPISEGAAVSRIRLFEVPNPEVYRVKLRLPPRELPQRHLFWREEMSDGVVGSRKEEERGVLKDMDWYEYKARLMQFLGMNTFSKDLLEFGHNQGWDSGETNDWYNSSSTPRRWEGILGIAAKYGLNVLPYYEYAGSIGQKSLGVQKRSAPLSGAKDYTHITWSEKANADITDPDTLADARRLLDATITRYKDRATFVGAWFRPRPSHLPISFSDGALQRFSLEASDGQSVTRVQLQNDAALRERYYAWWFRKRKDFLTALTAHLRANVHPDAVLLFTPDASEPGRSLSGGMQIVTDDVPVWTRLLSQPQPNNRKPSITAYNAVVTADSHFRALTSPTPTWGNWEWQHSDPQADPQNYAGADGPLLTYSFNRAYTVSSPKAFDAFRTQAGLAAIRHYPLNENAMDSSLGYFVADVERAGPYSMLPEARAMAYGDPRFIGYLAASSFNRGFPEYARAFYAAFLSLPALPSAMLPNAASDSEVVVRAIRTKAHGTYLAIVHVGLSEKRGVTVTLPTKGKVVDAATGKPLNVRNGKMRLSLYPCELKAVHIR